MKKSLFLLILVGFGASLAQPTEKHIRLSPTIDYSKSLEEFKTYTEIGNQKSGHRHVHKDGFGYCQRRINRINTKDGSLLFEIEEIPGDAQAEFNYYKRLKQARKVRPVQSPGLTKTKKKVIKPWQKNTVETPGLKTFYENYITKSEEDADKYHVKTSGLSE